MKQSFIVFVCILIATVTSCESNSKQPGKLPGEAVQISSNSYVGAYYSPLKLGMRKFVSSGYVNVYSADFDFCSIGSSSSRHKSISEYYGDTGYDTTYNYVPHIGDPHQFLSDEITSINIVSTAEYNGIPAGENLNNQFYLYAMSMYPFIQSGYTDKFDYASEYAPSIFLEMQQSVLRGSNNPSAYLGSPIYGTVDEIDVDSLKIIGGSTWNSRLMFLLQMKQIPVNPEGELIVTVGFKDGKQLEARGPVYDLIN